MRNAIILGLDGTLANCDHRLPYIKTKDWDAFHDAMDDDYVNINVWKVLKLFIDMGVIPFILTGRPERYRIRTEKWLTTFSKTQLPLFMRKGDDFRKASEIKQEIFQNVIKPEYKVTLALEDSDEVCEMWRGQGIECWQVDRQKS